MLAEDVAWTVHHQPRNPTPPFLRRKRYIAVALLLIALLYLLVELVPDENNVRFGYHYVRDSYDWSSATRYYPISEYTPLPTGTPLSLPRVQYDFPADDSDEAKAREGVLAARRSDVKAAFVKSWNSYKETAFGEDELLPVTGGGTDKTDFGGWGTTLIDSLDTLWMMDLKDDFHEAVAAAVKIDYSKTNNTQINYFETVIRHLGGLLGAYDLSLESALLEKAVELADLLYIAYDTPNNMPPMYLNFNNAKRGNQITSTAESSSAVASSSLEFTRMSQLTGNYKYYDAINRVTKLLADWQNQTMLPGLWPAYLDLLDEELTADYFSLGADADSLYEYLPKEFAQLGGLEPLYEDMYRSAMDTVIKHILFRPRLPDKDDILFPGTVYISSFGPTLTAESEHLSCFIGGMFALGGKLFDIDEHVAYAERLTRGCVWAYGAFASGLMPETFDMMSCDSLDGCDWSETAWESEGQLNLTKGFTGVSDPSYILRPEALESVFYMYRVTGNSTWQDMAWTMFESIRNATETELAFSAIESVEFSDTVKTNSMESFWLAETLKYAYLIFSSPDLISLDEFVFNTEAHPFRRPVPEPNRHPLTYQS
ncbi:glycoside hydrolase family 47 protein [Xylariaceae sp. FL1272]|nr:glycoside hydrolase family 47 protein [Xylariaceae sp. FL1272]